MSNWNQIVALSQDFQKNVEGEKFSQAESQLTELKKIMLDLNSLPPMGAETPNASAERQLFAKNLEYAVLLSIGQGDKDNFQKYVSSLRPYYTQYGFVESNPTPVTYMVLGLNLLYLLVENRLADFHCELELLSAKTRSHAAISFCTQLEKHLVVGAYDEVLTAAKQPPVPSYSFFLNSLLETVRVNIGECISSAYEKILVPSASKLLMFKDNNETLQFIQENYSDWVIQGNEIHVKTHTRAKKVSEINSYGLIQQQLSYATELDRIV